MSSPTYCGSGPNADPAATAPSTTTTTTTPTTTGAASGGDEGLYVFSLNCTTPLFNLTFAYNEE